MSLNLFSLRNNRYINTGLSQEAIKAKLNEAVRTRDAFKDFNINFGSNGNEFTLSRQQNFFTTKKELAIIGKGRITSLGKNKTEVCIRYKCTDLRYQLITTFCTAISAIIVVWFAYHAFAGGLKKSIQLSLIMLIPFVLNYINIKIRAKAYAQAFFVINYELIDVLDPDGEYIEDEVE